MREKTCGALEASSGVNVTRTSVAPAGLVTETLIVPGAVPDAVNVHTDVVWAACAPACEHREREERAEHTDQGHGPRCCVRVSAPIASSFLPTLRRHARRLDRRHSRNRWPATLRDGTRCSHTAWRRPAGKG